LARIQYEIKYNSHELSFPSAFLVDKTLLILESVPSGFALPLAVPLSRFGYLLNGVSPINLGNKLFPTLMGFYPSELYSFPMAKKKFPFFYPLLHFFPRPASFE
jgi:hypothetical protein